MTIIWANPDDDSITGYVILRRDKDLQTEEGTFFTVVSNTGTAATTYTDDTVAASTTYTYWIKAINAHGLSEISGMGAGLHGGSAGVATGDGDHPEYGLFRPRTSGRPSTITKMSCNEWRPVDACFASPYTAAPTPASTRSSGSLQKSMTVRRD